VDTALAGHDSDVWRIAAVSTCGSGHLKLGTPCQDAHCWRSASAGIVAGAVADGAGSAPFSEIGARLAAAAAVDEICRRLGHPEADAPTFTDEGLREILDAAWRAGRSAIEEEAELREQPARSFAATLIAFAAAPGWVAVVQIGDGASLLHNCGGEIIPLTLPRIGEYINETTFLTSPEAEATLQCEIWRGEIAQFCAFTDGLQALALKLPEATPHPPFFRPLFKLIANASASEAEAEMESFLTSDRIRNRADDDLTLLLAHLL